MNAELKSLFSIEEVLDIEAKASQRIWVLAPDIAFGPQKFKPLMINNIRDRRIEYRYVVSDDDSTLENLYEFIAEMKDEGAVSSFGLGIMPKHIIESDVTIYDPNTPHERAFILAPCETTEHHWCLRGSALFRMKERFAALWRISDKIDLNRDLQYPFSANVVTRSFISEAWRCGLGARKGSMIQQWELLGRKLAAQESAQAGFDPRQRLISGLIHQYSSSRDLCPAFDLLEQPEVISDTTRILIREILTCHLGGAYSASLGMCGKLLETALRYYIADKSGTEADAGMGLGKLIRKVTDEFGLELDEGVKVLANFINQFRITGVHSKRGFELPTYEQSLAVLYSTYDTLRKLFGETTGE